MSASQSLAPRSPASLETVYNILNSLGARYRQEEVLTAVRQIPARDAEFLPMPAWVTSALAEAYRAKGIQELYSHQAATAELVRNGKNVVVVTPTASGKTHHLLARQMLEGVSHCTEVELLLVANAPTNHKGRGSSGSGLRYLTESLRQCSEPADIGGNEKGCHSHVHVQFRKTSEANIWAPSLASQESRWTDIECHLPKRELFVGEFCPGERNVEWPVSVDARSARSESHSVRAHPENQKLVRLANSRSVRRSYALQPDFNIAVTSSDSPASPRIKRTVCQRHQVSRGTVQFVGG